MNRNLESVLTYLADNKLKLVTAESVTAGLIASTLAEIPGCGSWLEGAFVTYSPDAKMAFLKVKPETIERFNLTSEEVAREMAQGALEISRANVALSSTGVAGPGAGEGGIPEGTICFAWAFERDGKIRMFSETRQFDGDRNQIRQSGAEYAIERIWYYNNELAEKE